MATEQAFEVDVQDVEYQTLNGKARLARVYRPKGTGPFPAMVDIHGGAWNNGDRLNNSTMDQALAERGIVIAALDFRQPPEAAYPASIADVNLGIRWLKANASEFHTAGPVGAIGNSSGGHQAVLAGIRPTFPLYTGLPLPGHPEIDGRLAYVVACWPVIDPLYRYQYAKRLGREELVNSHLRYWGSEEAMAAGSPPTIADQGEEIELPPIFMMLKANDQSHPVEMQEHFIASYRLRGGPIEVETFQSLPERGMDLTNPETTKALNMITDFARRHSAR